MGNTGNRSFRLLALLQNHRYWAGAELADRLGVSPRTLRRDVERLRELGYPVTAHPGVDGGYQLAPGAVLPPLVVDDDEAVALAVGLLRAAQEAAAGDGEGGDSEGGIAEVAARALAKVSQVMPARLRRRAEAVAAMTEAATWDVSRGGHVAIDADVLAGTALACRDAERIRFGYVAASGERTERHAEPHRLVALERRWYLVAYDLTRQDWRSFRLDRIAGAVAPTGARFRPRELPAASAAEFVRRNITSPAPTYAVEAIVSAPAVVVRERIGRWAAVTEQGAASCLVAMTPPAGSDWAIIALGLTGADFRVLSPPELAAQVIDWAGRFARAAQASEAPAGSAAG